MNGKTIPCPRCIGGRLFLISDIGEDLLECVNCGYRRVLDVDLVKVADAGRRKTFDFTRWKVIKYERVSRFSNRRQRC
jgi:hypothetical protein